MTAWAGASRWRPHAPHRFGACRWVRPDAVPAAFAGRADPPRSGEGPRHRAGRPGPRRRLGFGARPDRRPGGQRTNHFDDDPYGNPTTATRANGTDVRDVGLFYHQPSGLYLATNRAYDPPIGHWLSRDPIGERGGINLYTYVGDNPLNDIDPQGFDESPASGGTPGDPRAPGPPPQAPYEPGGSNNGDPSGTPCPPPPPPPVYGPPATPAATPTGGPPANDNMRDA
jgi:RHS repeat-associated protein